MLVLIKLKFKTMITTILNIQSKSSKVEFFYLPSFITLQEIASSIKKSKFSVSRYLFKIEDGIKTKIRLENQLDSELDYVEIVIVNIK